MTIRSMRLLLVSFLAGGLAAADAVPFIDLSYVAGDGLRPAAPVDGWWDRTIADSQAWCAERLGGVRLEPPRAVQVRITAHTAADGRVMPGWSARWDGPLPAAAGAAIERRVATWQDFRSHVAGDTLALAGPGGVLDLPGPEHGAGWRLTVHGAGLDLGAVTTAAALGEMQEMLSQPANQDWRALICTMSVMAGVDPTASGPQVWVDAGIPAAWFRPIDPALIARVPSTAKAAAAVGIDGGALAQAITGLPESLRQVLGLGAAQAGVAIDPVSAAQAADGTWIAWATEQTFLIRMPRSHLLDMAMAASARNERKALPTDETPARLASDVCWARDDHEWLFADSVETINQWRAGGAGPNDLAALGGLPAEGSRLWAAAGRGVLDQVMGNDLHVLLPELPLAARQTQTEAMMKDLGIKVPDDALGVENIGNGQDPVRIGDRVVDGRLRITAAGGPLPWILPGLGIAWCAATIQEQEGRKDLIACLDAERAAGRTPTPSDQIAALPAPAMDEAAFVAKLEALTGPSVDIDAAWKRFVASGAVLPKDEAAAALLAQLESLLADSAFIDGVTSEAAAAAILRTEFIAGRHGYQRRPVAMKPAQLLAKAGRCLAAFGDARGLLLAGRGALLVAKPASMIDGLIDSTVTIVREDAFVMGEMFGLVPQERIQAWLAEAPRLWYRDSMQQECIATAGMLAERFLHGTGPFQMPEGATVDFRSSLLTPASLRGSAQADLAIMIACMHWLAEDAQARGATPAIHRWRSRLPGLLMPAVTLVTKKEKEGILRHHLMRLGVRLHQAGPLADQAAAVAAVGPLTLLYGDIPIPLTYTALPGGFELTLDPQARPEGIRDDAWKRLTKVASAEAVVNLPTQGVHLRLKR